MTAAVQPLLQDRAEALVTDLFARRGPDLGVEVQAEPVDMTAYLDAVARERGVDLLIGRWNADYDDPDNFTHSLFHSANGALRNVLLVAGGGPDPRGRQDARAGRPSARRLYRRFEGLLLESAALVPLFHDIDYRVVSSRVRGLRAARHQAVRELQRAGHRAGGRSRSSKRAAPAVGAVHIPIWPARSSRSIPCERIICREREVLPVVFETLTRDSGRGTHRAVAGAAIPRRRRRLRYRFRLRDDVTFHDGRGSGARDVRYSLERLLQSGTPWDRSCSRRSAAPGRSPPARPRDLAGFRIHSATEFSIELDEPIAFSPGAAVHIPPQRSSRRAEIPSSQSHALDRHRTVSRCGL